MYFWPLSSFRSPSSSTEALELQSKMADQVTFAKRVRKSLYYGEYSDASLPSLSVTDVAVEVLNNTVSPRKRLLNRKYAHSVARRAKISPCTLMMGMLYAERLHQRNPQGTTFLSSSDVFLISIMVASKYLYDEGEEEEVYNEDWAKAGCKTVQDINKLEMDFLQLMDWNLFISKDEFSNFVNQVESRVALTNGCARGWLTYSDMCTLLNNTALLKMLLEIRQQLLENISKCLAAYMLGVSILLGSSALVNLDSDQPSTMLAPTPVRPSSDCLTTEASCVFSREAIEVASSYGSNQVFPPIARRIRRGQGSFLKLQQLKNVSSPGERRVSSFYIQETLQTTKQNRTFSGLINIRPHLEDLRNLTPRNFKARRVYHSQDLNDSVGELSIQTGSFGCVHNLNASTSISLEKVGSFRSHIVYKGCFEELLLSRESSRELKCFHGQQVCTA